MEYVDADDDSVEEPSMIQHLLEFLSRFSFISSFINAQSRRLSRVIKKFWKKYGFKWNYYICWTSYLCAVTLLGGGAIRSFNSSIDMTDCLFLASSAVTGTGLSTVAMTSLSRGSIYTLLFCFVLGNSILLLLPAMIYRRHAYRQLTFKIAACDEATAIEYRNLYNAIGACIIVIISYLIIWHLCGVLFLYAALHMHSSEEELSARGYSMFENALFTTFSAHSNAGFTISSNSLFYLQDNPTAYLIIALVILSGNTAFPVFCRYYVRFITWMLGVFGRTEYIPRFAYIAGEQCVVGMDVLIWLCNCCCFTS